MWVMELKVPLDGQSFSGYAYTGNGQMLDVPILFQSMQIQKTETIGLQHTL
jgi:hypothetical protein